MGATLTLPPSYRCTACGLFHARVDLTGQTAPLVALACPYCQHDEAERQVMGSDLRRLEAQVHDLVNVVNALSLRARQDAKKAGKP